MFEYQSERKRAIHPVLSRRWVYRSAHKINGTGHHPDEIEVDPITDDDATDETDSEQDKTVAYENLDGIDLDEFRETGLRMPMEMD